MTGRKPLPTALKILRGNPGKRPLSPNEPKPTPKKLTCPRHLDASARTEWRRITKELYAMGLVCEVFRTGLAAYCTLYSSYVQACEAIAKTGSVLQNKETKKFYKNPFVTIRNEALRDMRSYLSEFGMTPSSLARVGGTVPPPHDDLAQFLTDVG